jgi:hypothetical protein
MDGFTSASHALISSFASAFLSSSDTALVIVLVTIDSGSGEIM